MRELRRLLLAATFALCACSAGTDGYESSGSKSEYSVMQAAEVKARRNLISTPTFRSQGEHILLVVPNDRNTGNIWIMLRPQHPPFYKQIPKGSYKISRDILNIVEERRLASSTVIESLSSHVPE